MREVVSREFSYQVESGVSSPVAEAFSREVSYFVEPAHPDAVHEIISREVSYVVSSTNPPPKIENISVTASPSGESVTLGWAHYDQWAIGDIDHFEIYYTANGAFSDIGEAGLTKITVPANTTSFTVEGLPAFTDHYFAVVAVDVLGNFIPNVDYAASYVLSPEIISREVSYFVEPAHPDLFHEVISREVSYVVSSTNPPPAIPSFSVVLSPSGDTATLGWSTYDQYAVGDIDRFDIYYTDNGPFNDVSEPGLLLIRVPEGSTSIVLEGLAPFTDHYFAIVPVDVHGSYISAVTYGAGYVLSPEVITREVSYFVESAPAGFPEVVSREVSYLVPDAAVPPPVTGLGSGFEVATSKAEFSAVLLDFTSYDEQGAMDVIGYDVYVGTEYFENVDGLTPFTRLPNGTQLVELTGLPGGSVLYFAVVAVDALANFNPTVRAQSALTSIAGVGEAVNFEATGGSNTLSYTWGHPPDSDDFRIGYNIYFDGTNVPVNLPASATTWQAVGLNPAQGYFCKICSVDGFGTESDGISILGATWLPNPGNLALTEQNGEVVLDWDAAEPSQFVQHYEIYRDTAPISDLGGMLPVQTTPIRSAVLGALAEVENDWFAVATVNILGDTDPEVESIQVFKLGQTIAFPAIVPGPLQIPLTATASSGLPVRYSVSPSQIAEIVGSNTLSVIQGGDVRVTAIQDGSANYWPAEASLILRLPPVIHSFTANGSEIADGLVLTSDSLLQVDARDADGIDSSEFKIRAVGAGSWTLLGNGTSANLSVSSLASGDYELLVGVTAAGTTATRMHTVTLDLQPVFSMLLDEDIFESMVLEGTVSIQRARSADLSVTIGSSLPQQVSATSPVVIPAGQTNTVFQIEGLQDEVIEIDKSVRITASAPGAISAERTVMLIDDDWPSISLALSRSIVPESAGPNAVAARVEREPATSEPLTVWLANSDPSAANVPESVVIPAGESFIEFPVGAVDDDLLDGPQVAEIQAEARLGEMAIAQSDLLSLEVGDDEGPTLELRSSKGWIFEGETSPLTVVRHGGDTNEALEVAFDIDLPAELWVPSAATMASNAVDVDVVAQDNTNGSRVVIVTASATNYGPGQLSLVVTDEFKPDFAITGLQVPTELESDETFEVAYLLENQGSGASSQSFVQRVFLSSDAVPGSDILLAQSSYVQDLDAGDSVALTNNVRAPQEPGEYWMFVVADAGLAVDELVEWNNAAIFPQPITVGTPWSATVAADADLVPANTPILLYGSAIRTGGEKVPFATVNLHIRHGAIERVVSAITDAAGDYELLWQPLLNEGGDYEVGACHPGVDEAPAQDTFTILAATPYFPEETLEFTEGGGVSFTGTVFNPTAYDLTGLWIEILDAPEGFGIETTVSSNVLVAGSGVEIGVAVVASNGYHGARAFVIRLVSDQGTVLEVTIQVDVRPLMPTLVLQPGLMKASVLRGSSKVLGFTIENSGGLETGDVEILLPAVPWINLASPGILPSIPPGGSATVSLVLQPGAEQALTLYSGHMVVAPQNGDARNLPYEFRVVSDAAGDLEIEVTDEYTYYAAGSPRVEGATVVLRDAITAEELARGETGTNGIVRFDAILEGWYSVEVDSPDHSRSVGNYYVDAGETNHETIFITGEFVTYTWTAEEIELEDRYRIVVESTYEVNVPAPVITIEPGSLDISDLNELGATKVVNLRIVNHGFIAAEQGALTFSDHPDYVITPLIEDIGTIPAKSEIIIPVTLQRTGVDDPQPAADLPRILSSGGGCSMAGQFNFSFICGPISPGKSVSIPVSGFEGCGGCCGWWGAGEGGSGDNDASLNAVAFGSSSINCTNPCLLYALLDCFGGCPWGLYKCYRDGDVLACIESGLGCVGVSIPLKGQLECIYGIYKCLKGAGDGPSPMAYGDSDSRWLSIVGEDMRAASPELGAAIGRAETELDFYAALLGSRERVLGSDGPEMAEWHQRRVDYMQAGSDEGTGISATEMADLNILAIDLEIDPLFVMPMAERMNRTLDYYARGIRTAADVPPGESLDFVDEIELAAAAQAASEADAASQALGFADPQDELKAAFADVVAELQSGSPGVCAEVRIQVEQQAVMTRSAFRASLELVNRQAGVELQQVAFDLEVRDASGQVAGERFNVQVTRLEGLDAVDGTGTIASMSTGTAEWTLIPRDTAAPEFDTVYTLGGTISYVNNGTALSIPVQPVAITVRPDAALYLKYFHQRDVVSDDPHTDPIEAKEPFALAVVVENRGAGAARNLTITSAQPEIVDNEKGLLIDFEIIASEIAGEARSPSLMADFGNIDPGQQKVATWWMTASLHGFFKDFEASFEHLDGFGDPRLSLIKEVEIFEMVRVVNALGAQDDGQPDFLTNEQLDFSDYPIADTLHLSDGTVTNVEFLGEGAACSNVTAGNLTVELAFTNGAQSGWTYLRFPDPADGAFRLAEVVRSDALAIPLGTNVWTTDRTFTGLGKKPVYENFLHLVDRDSTGSYTLRYEAIPADAAPPWSMVDPLPADSGVFIPVSWGGTDNVALATFDILVSTNGGPWGIWLDNTTRIGSIFQGEVGSTYAFYSLASDTAGNIESKAPAAEASTTVSIVNQPPVLNLIAATNMAEGATLEYQVDASDPDGSTDDLRCIVAAERSGVVVSSNGVVRWATSELDGGTSNRIQVTVLDAAIPQGLTSAWFTVSVDEVNAPPVLESVLPQTAEVDVPFQLYAQAFDPDVPAQTIAYSLGAGAPAGMAIDGASGLLAWTPPTNGVGQSMLVSLVATDDGIPAASATNEFTILVVEKILDTTPPLQVQNLGVTPDTGMSDTDGIISVTNFNLTGMLAEANLMVEVYSGMELLATSTPSTLALNVPLSLGQDGAVELTVRCIDASGNASDSRLDLFIDLDAPLVDLQLDGTMKDATNYMDLATARMVFSEQVNVPDLIANRLIERAIRFSATGSNDTVVAPIAMTLDWDAGSNTLEWSIPTNTVSPGGWMFHVDGRFFEDVAGNRLAVADGDESFTEQGMAVYETASELTAVYSYAAPAWHDFDGDGLADLMVGEKTASSTGQIRIYLNGGASTNPAFGSYEVLEVDGAPLAVPASGCLGISLRLADLTGDALADLVVGRADGSVWLYETASISSNDWNFGAGAQIWSGASRAMVDAYDMDGDGTNEVVVGGMDGRFSLLDDGGASYLGDPLVVAAGRSAPSVADLNSDDWPELVSGDSTGGLWSFFGTAASNVWNNTPLALLDLPTGWSRTRPCVADCNSDGIADILVGTADGAVRLFLGALPKNPALEFAVAEPAVRYTLTASSGEGGDIEPEGSVLVYEGENQTFSMVPEDYWHVEDVLANGLSLGAVLSHTFSNVTENGQIHAEFAPNMVTNAPVPVPESWLAAHGWTNNFEFAVTNDFDGDGFQAWEEYVAGTSPTVKASLFRITQIRNEAGGLQVTWSPSTAGRRYRVMRAGTPAGPFAEAVATLDGPADTLTVPASGATGMFRVEVELSEAPPQWTVMAFAGANGSISPQGLQYATPGSNTFHFAITPNQWHHVADVKTNGVSVGAVESLTLSNVTENTGIQAEFALNMVVSAPVAIPERWLAEYGWTNNFDAVVTNDFDGDGFAVWQEYVAGSSPTNKASYFRITQIRNNEGGLVISWTPSVEERRYRLLRGDTPAGPFTEVVATISGPADTLIVPASQAHGFFRMQVEMSDAPPIWSVVAVAGANGSISPSGLLYASPGSNTLHFSIAPQSWYHVADVTVNGVSTGAVETLVLENIKQNMDVRATFAANMVTNAPVHVPEHWLARHGWTNNFEAAVINDADGDGFSTWQEYVAGSWPTNPASYFHITTNKVVAGQWIVAWEPSVAERVYTPVFMDLSAGTNAPLPQVDGPAHTITNGTGAASGMLRVDVEIR